jgi:HeH/LEM domain-containing protein
MEVIVKYPHSVDYKKKLYLPGESLDVPDKEAKRLLGKDRVEIPAEEEIIAKTPEPKDMTVAELKKLLDKLEVPYDAKALKPELIKLVEENTAEPPEE